MGACHSGEKGASLNFITNELQRTYDAIERHCDRGVTFGDLMKLRVHNDSLKLKETSVELVIE